LGRKHQIAVSFGRAKNELIQSGSTSRIDSELNQLVTVTA
jgi:hypothetical protein